MTDPHPPPLRALQEDGDADIFAQTSVKEDTLSRRGTFVGRDNRLAISVQTHFFDFGSVAAVDRKLFRSADAWDGFSFAGSPTGEEGGSEKPWKQRFARGERASCAEKHTGEATFARRRKCENTLELQGGWTPAESPGQAIAREPWMHLIRQMITLDKRRQRYGRGGVHTENAWKQTRRQRFEVAGRKTSERARSTGT